jgi:hypothetical protein
MLENQSVFETALDNEHAFATGGTQTGDHTQGSARCFSQASAPATRVDGSGFLSTDLGSIWVDTDDNAVYVLTATTPTWTPVSDEVIATLLAANRVFAGTLGVDGNLDVTGDIDPTSYDTANGGFLDEDDMTSDSATATVSQQSVNAFAGMVPAQTAALTGYGGEESVTFPNGLILKTGEESVLNNATDTLTYAAPFPNAVVNMQVSYKDSSVSITDDCVVRPTPGFLTSKIDVTNADASTRVIYWQAWGY